VISTLFDQIYCEFHFSQAFAFRVFLIICSVLVCFQSFFVASSQHGMSSWSFDGSQLKYEGRVLYFGKTEDHLILFSFDGSQVASVIKAKLELFLHECILQLDLICCESRDLRDEKKNSLRSVYLPLGTFLTKFSPSFVGDLGDSVTQSRRSWDDNAYVACPNPTIITIISKSLDSG
jgi:hypothetical protein